MKKVVLIGECMLELTRKAQGELSSSFAGDTYNTAVYLKRTFKPLNVSFMTAIGQDAVSKDMLEQFQAEQLNTEFVFEHQNLHPGAYMVQTDEQGERSFLYWRNESAAKQLMQHVSDYVVSTLSEQDVIFFSGITLAILNDSDRASFFHLLEQARSNGTCIAFDPNYRPSLWLSPSEASKAFEQAFNLTDIALPGLDDFAQLYGMTSSEEVLSYFENYALQELVIKNGPHEVVVVTSNEGALTIPIEPSQNVVDTTSAGDAFNAVYLGSRFSKLPPKQAVIRASDAAKFVIAHPGAIAPKEAYETFLRS